MCLHLILVNAEHGAISSEILTLPQKENTYGERMLEFTGVNIWNSLPRGLKVANNFFVEINTHHLKINEALSIQACCCSYKHILPIPIPIPADDMVLLLHCDKSLLYHVILGIWYDVFFVTSVTWYGCGIYDGVVNLPLPLFIAGKNSTRYHL